MEMFNFVGKLVLPKETEKFVPISTQKFESGWQTTRVNFNLVADHNRVGCRAEAGCWDEKHDAKNVVYSFTKSEGDKKGEKIQIPWDKRFDEAEVSKIAGNRKFKIQLPGEEKEEEFIAEWDFVQRLIEVLKDEQYKDELFYVGGYYDIQRGNNGKFYTSYRVNRVSPAKEGQDAKTEIKMNIFFGADSFVELEDGKAVLNGWLQYYDNNVKANGFCETAIVFREDEKKIKGLKRKFSCDGEEIKSIGLKVAAIDGAQRVEVTEDMLSDEEKEDLELGLITWDELKKKYSNGIVGDRVRELRFTELWGEKSSVEDTTYHVEDMVPAKVKEEEKVEVEEEDEDNDSVPFPTDDDEEEL